MRNGSAAPRVLVCEDPASGASSLAVSLGHGDELDVSVCSSSEDALRAIRETRPDLVAIDIDPPGEAGLRIVEQIVRENPLPVVVLSEQATRTSPHVRAARAAGAVEVLAKGHLEQRDSSAAVVLRHRLRRLARASNASRQPTAGEEPVLRPIAAAKAVAICASTGGPGALATVLADLPASFSLPVLVVQHMADGFIDSLVGWLGQRTPLPVAVVRATMPMRRGVWFAPDDANLTLRTASELSIEEPSDGSLVPSADVLLTSMADVLGPRAIAVVLTGMGRDGGRGVAEISRAGGFAIAQDEQTSVVFGMPRIAAEHGAKIVLPLGGIAGALRQLAPRELSA
jgi:two-component system, chemotaxis family, protein-glutamate methylesterase/glutaminase